MIPYCNVVEPKPPLAFSCPIHTLNIMPQYDRIHPFGYSTDGPATNYARVKAWRHRNSEKVRLMDSEYKRMSRNPVFRHSWPLIVAHYGGKCLCCGKSSGVCADHVVSLSDTNACFFNNLFNLQPLCRACNTKKESGVDYRPDKGAWIAESFPYALSQFKDIRKMKCVPYHLFKVQPEQTS